MMHEPLGREAPAPADADFTDDTLLGGTVRLRQPAAGYRAAIDPVFLAAAVPAQADDRVLDAGCGAGAAFLCLAHRVPGCTIVGIERDPSAAALARFNVRANGLDGRVEILEGDIAGRAPEPGSASFDHVMINPPFLDPKRSRPSVHAGRASATVEAGADLAAWVSFAGRMLRDRGLLTLVHRADRIGDITAALAPRFGGIERFSLLPFADRPAKRMIVRARKGSDEPSGTHASVVLHEENGKFTTAAEEILRHGRALVFS